MARERRALWAPVRAGKRTKRSDPCCLVGLGRIQGGGGIRCTAWCGIGMGGGVPSQSSLLRLRLPRRDLDCHLPTADAQSRQCSRTRERLVLLNRAVTSKGPRWRRCKPRVAVALSKQHGSLLVRLGSSRLCPFPCIARSACLHGQRGASRLETRTADRRTGAKALRRRIFGYSPKPGLHGWMLGLLVGPLWLCAKRWTRNKGTATSGSESFSSRASSSTFSLPMPGRWYSGPADASVNGARRRRHRPCRAATVCVPCFQSEARGDRSPPSAFHIVALTPVSSLSEGGVGRSRGVRARAISKRRPPS